MERRSGRGGTGFNEARGKDGKGRDEIPCPEISPLSPGNPTTGVG
jgi:hypothetical protein